MTRLIVAICIAGMALSAPAQSTGTTAQSGPMPAGAHPGGHAHKLGPPSTALTVNIDGKTKTFTLADLKTLPQQYVKVNDTKAGRAMTWSGPSLTDVFAASGMPFNHDTEHDVLHRYVVATGTDQYWVVFSAAEMIDEFHAAKTIVAIARDGQPLGTIGQFALFTTGDTKPARRVSNLESLDVMTAKRQSR